MTTVDITVAAHEVREGDRIIMRPTWPEGRLVVDVERTKFGRDACFTFEGGDEPRSFYTLSDPVLVRRALSDAIPTGFRSVDKEEFFAALYADSRDIMPSIVDSPYFTTWETRGREVWGWTAPGWKNPRGQKIYALKK